MKLKIEIDDLQLDDAIDIAKACCQMLIDRCGAEHKAKVSIGEEKKPDVTFRGEESTFDRYLNARPKE